MAEYINRKQAIAVAKYEFGNAGAKVMSRVPYGINLTPVVFCKDCIHYEQGICLKIYSDGAMAKEAWHARKDNDFCSYGERR